MDKNLAEEYKKILKTYGVFMAIVYAMYFIFMVGIMYGDQIIEWFGGLVDKIKGKFRRTKSVDTDNEDELSFEE